MAEKEDPTEQATDDGEAGPAKKKIPLALFIGVGLAAGAGVGVFLAGPLLAKKVAPAASAEAPLTAVKEGGKDGKSAEKGGAKGAKETDVPVYIIDNLVLNPAGSGGTRFLLASIGIQVSTSPLNESLKKHDIEAREVVLRVLGVNKVEELAEMSNRDLFKAQIRTALENMLGKDSVKGIYFSQFVIQ